MTYPLVVDLAAEGIPVAVTCRVLGFSKQAFYAWRKDPVSQRDRDDAHVINAAYDVHADDPEFGYRFITDELIATHGFTVSENRVHRLCSQQRIFSTTVRRRGSGKKAGPAVHDDHVNRDFTADAINVKWLVDITEHRTLEGKVYLCAIKDCASNRIVGYAIDSRMTSELAVAALRMAIMLRGRPEKSSFIATEAVSFVPRSSSWCSATTASSDPWAESPPPATTPRWSPSSHCCKRTS